MKKRILSILLTLCMLMSVVPMLGITASAESAGDPCPDCGNPLEWYDGVTEHYLCCNNYNCLYTNWDTCHSNGAGGNLGCTCGNCASGGTGDNPGGGASIVQCQQCGEQTAQWQLYNGNSSQHCLICTNSLCQAYGCSQSIHSANECELFGCNYSSNGGTGGDSAQEAENLYDALTKPTVTFEDASYTLQADVVFEQSIQITDQKILYLNGHTITFNDGGAIVLYGGENGEYTPLLEVYGGSNEYAASCFDSDGSIISYDEYSYTTSSIRVMAGTLTVHGGKISGISIAYMFFKKVNIYGGFICGYDGCFDAENTTLNITGGYYATRGMLFDAENNPLYADGYGIKIASTDDAAYNQGYTYQVVKAVSLKSVSSLEEQGGVKFYQEKVGTDEQVTRSEVTSVVGGDFDPYVEAIDVPGYTVALSVIGDAALSYNYLYIDELYNSGSGIYPDSVTVTAAYTAKTKYSVTADTCTGGTVTVDKSSTYEGDTVTVTATPDSGYELDKIYVNGTAIDGTTFTMPAYAVTVSATFKQTIPAAVASASCSASLTLKNNIDVNFKVKNIPDAEKDKLEVYLNGESVDFTLADGVTSAMTVSVSPEDIGKDIHIAVTYDGVTVKDFNYSVIDYCNAVFAANTNGKYDKIADICTALLNYGKYAEDYAKGNTESTVNEGHEITFGDSYDFAEPTAASIVLGNYAGANTGATLQLSSTIKLVFSLDDCEVDLEKDDEESQNFFILNGTLQINPNRVEIQNEGGTTTVSIDMYAYQLATQYTLKLKGVNTSEFRITYGVYNYCYNMQSSSDATLKALCQAIHAYSEAVQAYIA